MIGKIICTVCRLTFVLIGSSMPIRRLLAGWSLLTVSSSTCYVQSREKCLDSLLPDFKVRRRGVF